ERPRRFADRQLAQILTHLRLEVAQRVRTFHHDDVARPAPHIGDGQRFHICSLPWHTRRAMYANEGLVDRAVATITRLAHKVTRAAPLVLLAALVICVGSFLLGMEALSGGIETVWIVLAYFFGAIAIGCALLARLRIGRGRSDIPASRSHHPRLVG